MTDVDCNLPREDGLSAEQSATFLTVGTAVSAKYRGAFCEATVDKVAISFKLRVQLKANKNVVCVDHSDVVSGQPILGSEVTVRHGTGTKPSGSNAPSTAVGTVIRVIDTSLYTVVFDDGDKRTLRRTQLVNKGERHFKESESLDCLPLTNPEQFRQPVIDRKKVRLDDSHSSDDTEEDRTVEESLSTPSSVVVAVADEHKKKSDDDDAEVQEKSNATSKDTSTSHKKHRPPPTKISRLLGRVVLVDIPVSFKVNISTSASAGESSFLSASSSDTSNKRRFIPALVVLPSAMPGVDLRPPAGLPTKTKMLLVRSFKDNRFIPVPACYCKRLWRPTAVELAHAHSSLRAAFERAIMWIDCYELPAAWGEDATQSLLGASDWRSAKRAARAERRKRMKADGKHEKTRRDRLAHVRRTTSTPKRPSASSSSILASKRVLASISKKTDAKRSTLTKSSPVRSASPSPVKRTSPRSLNKKRPSKQTKKIQEDSSHSSESDFSSSEISSSSSDSSSSSVDFETRDRWTAQLYRFMDEGGTPINKAPSLANKDLDLYKLFKLVRELGGFHRVTAQFKWGYVYSKLKLPHNFAAGPRYLQAAFKRYLYPLDDANRKLGVDLDTLPLARPRTASSSLASATPRAGAAAQRPPPKQPPKPTLVSPEAPVAAAESSPPVLSPPVLGPSPGGEECPPSPTNSLVPQGARQPSRPVLIYNSPIVDATGLRNTAAELKQTAVDSTPIKSARQSTTTTTPGGMLVDAVSLQSVSSSSSKDSSHTKSTTIRPPPVPLADALKTAKPLDSHQVIPIGSQVLVRCDRMTYMARVLKHVRAQTSEPAGSFQTSWSSSAAAGGGGACSPGAGELMQYRVHYIGWNARHDEVISRSRIIRVENWADPTDPERPPSCSSLSLTIEHPRLSNTLNYPTKLRKQHFIKPENEQDEDDDGDDQSGDRGMQIETASDIVTTTAPMVRRRRRIVFPPNAGQQIKRPRLRDEKSRLDDGHDDDESRVAMDTMEWSVETKKATINADTSQSRERSPSPPSTSKRLKIEPEQVPKKSAPTAKPVLKSPTSSKPVVEHDSQTKKTKDESKKTAARKDSTEPTTTPAKSTAQNKATSKTSTKSSDAPNKEAAKKPADSGQPSKSSKTKAPSTREGDQSVDGLNNLKPASSEKTSSSSKTVKSTASSSAKSTTLKEKPDSDSKQPANSKKKPSRKTPLVEDAPSSTGKDSRDLKRNKTTTSEKKDKNKSRTQEGSSEDSDSSNLPRTKSATAKTTPDDSTSTSDEDTSSSEYGGIDALPRLTRNQHRQLLGDTPPGAVLQTASPITSTTPPAKSNEPQPKLDKPKTEPKETQPPVTVDPPIVLPTEPTDSVVETTPSINLRPRQRTPAVTEGKSPAAQPIPAEEEDDDDVCSIHTLSTEPMRDAPFDLNMSQRTDSDVCSSDDEARSAGGDSSEEQSSSSPPSENRMRSVEGKTKHPDSQTNEQDSQSKSRTKHARRTGSSVSSVATNEMSARKTSKRSHVSKPISVEKSPTPIPQSPSPPSTSGNGMFRLDPALRRFGGPFFPIPGFEELSSEMRCLHLQESIKKIVESWRAAKSLLKELDARSANRAIRRARSKPNEDDGGVGEPSAISQPA